MLLASHNELRRALAEEFQWAPTLGGECYRLYPAKLIPGDQGCFNGHPPLGVNATIANKGKLQAQELMFQWAPTLGGECYIGTFAESKERVSTGFNGHPPLGVNATCGIVYLITPPLCQGVDALLNNSKRL